MLRFTHSDLDESSDLTDEDEKVIPLVPFKMEFKLTDEEEFYFKEAFEDIMDEDKKINFEEFYNDMEKRGWAHSENIEDKVFYETLSKIMQYQDLTPKGRINFDEFLALVIEAMNARRKRAHVSLMFDIFDTGKTGTIASHDLSHISRNICNELEPEIIKSILNNCSTNRRAIT